MRVSRRVTHFSLWKTVRHVTRIKSAGASTDTRSNAKDSRSDPIVSVDKSAKVKKYDTNVRRQRSPKNLQTSSMYIYIFFLLLY